MEIAPRPSGFRLNVIWACLLAALVAVLTYQGTLHYFFSASDSLTLIQTSRLTASHGLVAVFSERIMNGTAFEGVFYRPVSVLSYQLDYWVWQLDPFGYHLTNLLLHVLATIMTLLLGLRLTRGMLRTSLLAALLFTCHPVLVETVPAIARRQDILETLFLLLSFHAYLQARSRGGRILPAVSVLCYVLALGSKETGIQLPALIFSHALIFAGHGAVRWRVRLRDAVVRAAPYLGVTALYLVWRVHVLGGLGYDGAQQGLLWITVHYFAGLIYPQDFLGLRDSLTWGPIVGTVAAVVGVFGFTVAVAGIARRRRDGFRLPILLLVWLVLPLFILLATGNFAYRSLYATVVPFSLMLALVVRQGCHWLRRQAGPTVGWAELPILARRSTRLVLFGGMLVLTGSLFALSPLFRDYPLWRQSGVIADRILTMIAAQVAELPPRTTIIVDGLPRSHTPAIIASAPRAHSVSYLRDYSIRSWLELTGLDRDFTVRTGAMQDLPAREWDLDLVVRRETAREIEVELVWLRK